MLTEQPAVGMPPHDSRLGRSPRLTGRRRWAALALAVFSAMGCWALSSPIGASPDDDFHLASIWCAGASCPAGDLPAERVVPAPLLEAPLCYRFLPEVSAACQDDLFVSSSDRTVSSDRLNTSSLYPPLYYRAMHVFSGEHLVRSALLMRLVNVVVAIVLVGLVVRVSAGRVRQGLLLSWLVAGVPLGVFCLASNNPSSWAVTGIGTCWAALLAMVRATDDRTRVVAAGLAVVGALMAAGARADSAAYLGVTLGAVVLTHGLRASLRRQPPIVYAVVGVIVALATWSFLGSAQSNVVADGFPTGNSGRTLSVLLEVNVRQLRIFLLGMLGRSWGLGWLDTTLPATVWRPMVLVLLAVLVIALRRDVARTIAPGLFVVVCMALITVGIHVQSSMFVGEGIQPRYLLPLYYLAIGTAVAGRDVQSLVAPRWLRLFVVLGVSGANAIALHVNLRRYVTGRDVTGWNLDAGREWWWPAMPSPMAVWVVGSLSAFVAAVLVLGSYGPTESRSALTILSSERKTRG